MICAKSIALIVVDLVGSIKVGIDQAHRPAVYIIEANISKCLVKLGPGGGVGVHHFLYGKFYQPKVCYVARLTGCNLLVHLQRQQVCNPNCLLIASKSTRSQFHVQ